MLAVHVLLHDDARALAAWRADPLGDQPGQGRGGEVARARRHLLPRHDRLFHRHARHPPARPVPGAVGRLLERGLHRHQRSVLDAEAGRNGGAGGSTFRSGDKARGADHGRIPEHLHAGADPHAGPNWAFRLRGNASERLGKASSSIGTASSATPRSGRSISAGSASPSLRLRLHRHRDHRAQHVGLGELGSGAVRAPAASGWRSTRLVRNTGSRSCRRCAKAAGG